MRSERNRQLSEDLSRIFRQGAAPAGDRDLLGRFLVEGDQVAFERLLARHGPMVLGVCRRLSDSPHDADDAFQATFLVLVRKGARLHNADRLGPWLYGVAIRVATKARIRKARQRQRHQAQAEEVAFYDGPNTDLLDVRPILDAELGRIPAKLRDVLILCLLEGATAEEASSRLGCPLGTVKSRLARGREALRTRLIGRGFAPGIALVAPSSISTPPVPESLAQATLNVIAGSSTAVAPGITILTRGVASAMLPRMTLTASLLLGGIALAGLGMVSWIKAPAVAQQSGGAGARPSEARTPGDVSTNHVRQILLAFHNYISVNGHLPPSAIYGADGQAKLSWRVALLPYLGEGALYHEFRMDEPWDSPHNKALIARMPAVFRIPDSPAPEGESRLRGFFGPGALFDGVRGIGLEEIIDGTSNTVLIVSAKEPIVWTKPGELVFKPGQPLPTLDDTDPSSCLVGMCDGSTRYVSPQDWTLLSKMITRAGREAIHLPIRNESPDVSTPTTPPLPPTTPPLAPTAPRASMPRMTADMSASTLPPGPGAATPGPVTTETPLGPDGRILGTTVESMPAPARFSIEQRLQRLEEKLDSLIQRFDAQAAGRGKP